MVFFSQEDKKSSGEHLFVFLRNMNTLLTLKLYGSRRQGDFTVYFNAEQERVMTDELQLTPGKGDFSFSHLLDELNKSIPQQLAEQKKIETLRTVWPQVHNKISDIVDDAKKTILVGVKKLPEDQRPREKTLRKLYLHTNGSAKDIQTFINQLKENNYTLMWTDDPRKVSKSFIDLMLKIK
ncbi:hypothetical protein KU75_14860 [Pectobacterium odoriferum]|uniref:Uncharacterized protein n=2 Tax=Pectobacteriaceae TaxID=1903410 RepID=A0ABR4VNL2_9GAMM|nr:hypothetical protein KU75_14860 [Pectobacterium odoriferum]